MNKEMTRREFLFVILAIFGLSKLFKIEPKPKVLAFEKVFVPTFEIASCPSISLADIKARRFDILDRQQIAAKIEMQSEEDKQIWESIRQFAKEDYESVTKKELLKNGQLGHLWSSELKVSSGPAKYPDHRDYFYHVDAEL